MEGNRTYTCLPPFSYDIHTWVAHVQACLSDPAYTDQQKYLAVVRALPTEVAALIRNIIVNPPTENKFTAITSALSTTLGRPQLSYLRELDNLQPDGRRPSLLLSHMQTLNTASGMNLPEQFLRQRHLQCMPQEIRIHLASLSDTLSLDEYGKVADRLHDQLAVYSNTGPSSLVAGGGPRLHNTAAYSCANVQDINAVKVQPHNSDEVLVAILSRLSDLEKKISDNVNVAPVIPPIPPSVPPVLSSNPSSAAAVQVSRPANAPQVQPQPPYCYYHRRFGNQARHCTSPCSWAGNGLGGGY